MVRGERSVSAWGFLVALESGETYSLPTAPVIKQLEDGHFFGSFYHPAAHLFASVHDAVLLHTPTAEVQPRRPCFGELTSGLLSSVYLPACPLLTPFWEVRPSWMA